MPILLQSKGRSPNPTLFLHSLAYRAFNAREARPRVAKVPSIHSVWELIEDMRSKFRDVEKPPYTSV